MTRASRVESIDALRGLAMVVMALDHTRDFFGTGAMDPRDVANPALFLTRWVTHFCAPVFVFLAGTSAYLYGQKNPGDLSRFLFTRGLWLIFLEGSVVRLAWTFDWIPGFFPFHVIWAIGVSMCALAVLSRLPVAWVGVFGVIVIAGHELLDGIQPELFGRFGWAWTLFYGFGPLAPIGGAFVPFVAYAVVPWVGVVAAGHAFGTVVTRPAPQRRHWLFGLGLGLCALFILIRAFNGYGDPGRWIVKATTFQTVLSFVNVQKYPPSLLFLLLTLGPAIGLLGFMDRGGRRIPRALVTIGRVPLFYYVLHLFLIHGAALLVTAASGGSLKTLRDGFHPVFKHDDFGYGLPWVYVAWLGVVFALYPLCRWFAGVKQRRSEWWLSYL